MSLDVQPARLTRHDLLLALIATPLVLAGVVGTASAVPLPSALAAGCVPSGGGLGYALFYRPPGDDSE